MNLEILIYSNYIIFFAFFIPSIVLLSNYLRYRTYSLLGLSIGYFVIGLTPLFHYISPVALGPDALELNVLIEIISEEFFSIVIISIWGWSYKLAEDAPFKTRHHIMIALAFFGPVLIISNVNFVYNQGSWSTVSFGDYRDILAILGNLCYIWIFIELHFISFKAYFGNSSSKITFGSSIFWIYFLFTLVLGRVFSTIIFPISDGYPIGIIPWTGIVPLLLIFGLHTYKNMIISSENIGNAIVSIYKKSNSLLVLSKSFTSKPGTEEEYLLIQLMKLFIKFLGEQGNNPLISIGRYSLKIIETDEYIGYFLSHNWGFHQFVEYKKLMNTLKKGVVLEEILGKEHL